MIIHSTHNHYGVKCQDMFYTKDCKCWAKNLTIEAHDCPPPYTHTHTFNNKTIV